jgi:hypothetical protein
MDRYAHKAEMNHAALAEKKKNIPAVSHEKCAKQQKSMV